MVNLTPHRDTKQRGEKKSKSGRKSGSNTRRTDLSRKGTVSSRNKSVLEDGVREGNMHGHDDELHMMKEKLQSEMQEAHLTEMDQMIEAAGGDAEKLWAEQIKKSTKKHDKATELMRAKIIFGALRDRHHSKHVNMFKAFQDMDLDYGDEDPGTLKFDPFYKALQGLYFDRLVTKQEAHEIFDLVDNDHSGSIDFKELQQAFDYATGALGGPTSINIQSARDKQSPASPNEATASSATLKARTVLTDEEMIEKKMANKRLNELKYRILDKVCQKNSRKSIREALRKAYTEADVNQDGNLSYEEFSDWLSDGPGGLRLGFTDRDIRDITLACDIDLDGGIDSMEFINTIARRDRPDPRSFLNASREDKLVHMRNEKAKDVERRSKNLDQRVKTPSMNAGEISTRVWYSEDLDDAYKEPNVESARLSSTTLLAPLKRTMSSPAPLGPSTSNDEELDNTNNNNNNNNNNLDNRLKHSLLSSRSSNNLGNSQRRSLRRKRRDTNIFDSIQANLKQHVFHKTLNPGMVSRLNFEDFGKTLPPKRPEKGQKCKPVWANRLTFDRIGLGSGGVDLGSQMYASDKERLTEIRTDAMTNPAFKFCGRELVESVHARKGVRDGKRIYLKKQKGQLRRRILQRAHNLESTSLSRIRTKTFQRLRYLESMQEVEEFHVRTSYNTKGLIKSPIAARNQAGSFMLFRPPSPRGRREDNLQTGIGQRAAAIVDWSF